jgi:2-dehydropantoate 2-reductase
MTVVVVGAGALGITFSAALAASGTKTTLVARRDTSKALQEAGRLSITGALSLEAPLDESTIDLREPDEIDHADVIIFATKAHDLGSAARAVSHISGACVLGIQNGIVTNALLCDVFGNSAVLGATTTIAAERRGAGEVAITNLGPTYIGELDADRSDRSAAVVEQLQAAALPTKLVPNIESVQWSKAANVAGSFGVGLLTRASWLEAMESAPLTAIFIALVREVDVVARAHGVPLIDEPGFPTQTYVESSIEASLSARRQRIERMRKAGVSLERTSSLLQDLKAGRRTEADVIFTDLVERGHAKNLDVPRLEIVRDVAQYFYERHTQGE